jgi:D-alanyl-lipoteichoic acid acyltransferase DltB (MBOAT superfamily)
MLFNSFEFAYFFLIFFPLYWFLPHRGQNLLLLAGSYYFYGCWDWRFLSLLVISTVMDYFCGLAVDRIDEPRRRKLFVALSMALNLGMLGFFKYYNFFAASLQALCARWGWDMPLWQFEVLLPIGISFYTFQSMSYVIDVYRKDIKPTRNILEFAAFVSFFPHLVAGPIMRPTTLLPQIERKRRFNLDQFYQGAYLIFWGLTKKVVVADNLAKVLVNPLFHDWRTLNGAQALIAIYAFAFQIYCDFSGYTDAARGIAKCLGIELALNFNLPYFSTNPREFWQRWHISLSTWLRDYLYIPLGGSRGGRAVWLGNILMAAVVGGIGLGLGMYFSGYEKVQSAVARAPWLPSALGVLLGGACLALLFVRSPRRMTHRNLMLTMVIGGLWHGAAWTFVLWGFYQGLILILHRLAEPLLARVKPTDAVDRACWKAVRIFVTFHLICLGWLLFRAESLDQVVGMLDAIWSRPAIPTTAILMPLLVCTVPLMVYQLVQYLSRDLDVVARTPWYVRSVFYTVLFYAFILGGEFGGGQFIYFQF